MELNIQHTKEVHSFIQESPSKWTPFEIISSGKAMDCFLKVMLYICLPISLYLPARQTSFRCYLLSARLHVCLPARLHACLYSACVSYMSACLNHIRLPSYLPACTSPCLQVCHAFTFACLSACLDAAISSSACLCAFCLYVVCLIVCLPLLCLPVLCLPVLCLPVFYLPVLCLPVLYLPVLCLPVLYLPVFMPTSHILACTSSCLYVFLPVRLLACTSSWLYVSYLYVCLHVSLQVCLMRLGAGLYVSLPIRLLACTSAVLYVSLPVYVFLPVRLRACTSSAYTSAGLHVSLSVQCAHARGNFSAKTFAYFLWFESIHCLFFISISSFFEVTF